MNGENKLCKQGGLGETKLPLYMCMWTQVHCLALLLNRFVCFNRIRLSDGWRIIAIAWNLYGRNDHGNIDVIDKPYRTRLKRDTKSRTSPSRKMKIHWIEKNNNNFIKKARSNKKKCNDYWNKCCASYSHCGLKAFGTEASTIPVSYPGMREIRMSVTFKLASDSTFKYWLIWGEISQFTSEKHDVDSGYCVNCVHWIR